MGSVPSADVYISIGRAPATYRAVDLTTDTLETLTRALRSIFPRLKPMGIDKDSGAFIGQRTAIADRVVDQRMFDVAISKVDALGFALTVLV